MKSVLRSVVYLLTYKQIDDWLQDVQHITVDSDALSYFHLSTNPIISFSYENELYYFRPCPVIRRRRAYFETAMYTYFETLGRLGISGAHFKQEIPITLEFSDDERDSFRIYLEGKMKDRAFMKSMYRMDELSRKYGFSIWEEQSYDRRFFDSFGLTGLSEALYGIAVYFLWYMRSVSLGYRTLRIARCGNHSFFGGVRAIASRILAEELGQESQVTDAKLCVLETGDGKTRLGVLSPAAPGSRMKDTAAVADGSLQRQLLILNALDVLAYQPDHGPNNYNVKSEKGLYSVCAFDNDNGRTFFPMPGIRGVLAGCSPFVNGAGTVARPYFDKELAQRLETLDVKRLKERLSPYLNVLQIWALTQRIKRLRCAIRKTANENDRFLLESDEWNAVTAAKEIDGQYGTTYLSRALNDT